MIPCQSGMAAVRKKGGSVATMLYLRFCLPACARCGRACGNSGRMMVAATIAQDAQREQVIVAAFRDLERLLETIEEAELYHATCYVSMALDVMRRDHPELLAGH